ncbi:MAG: PAS domain S-box protein [Williamsia sp.]|nr:PAS domain S-box protein [Williamsia sp.]
MEIVTYAFSTLSILVILYSLHFFTDIQDDELITQQVLAIVAVVITTVLVISIKRLYRSINKERKQLNALFQFNPLSVIIYNCEEEIVLVNPAAQRLFGYTEAEAKGLSIAKIIPERFHLEHGARVLEYRNAVPENNLGHDLDIFCRKKNGEEFPAVARLQAYYQKRECYIISFVEDITERRESEEKFIHQKEQLEKITHDVRRMNTELENKVAERTMILREALLELEKSQTELSEALNKEKELNEIKSRFVSMASHEFRTPLSAILSSAALISKYQLTDDQEKRDKHIRRIKGSVNHLNLLLEDFLNLGKLEEGRVFVQPEPFDVHEFVLDTFDEMKHTLKQGQHMELAYSGETLFTSDKRLLKNVLINLLSNAVKFSEENKMIQVTIENSGSKMALEVKDEGIGIAKEDMQYLFSTFYRAKNAVNIQGTGLGLHIVKRYINLLEGSISISSELNKGCTFNIELSTLFEAPVEEMQLGSVPT